MLQDKIAVNDFKKRFTALHSSACNGANALIELGREINKFVESELYLVECPSVQEFFKKNFNLSESYINRLRRAAKFTDAQTLIAQTTGEAEIPAPPAAVRAARKSKVISKKQNLGPIKNTTTVENKNNSLVAVVVDALGEPIPPHALTFWHRKEEVEAVMQVIENLSKNFRERVRENDPLWTGLPAQQVEITLHNAFYAVKNFLPYAVCTSCQGHVANGSCDSCHNTGMVSQYHFEKVSSPLSKKIRDAHRKELHANA